MLRFTETPQRYPELRPAAERKQDFREIYNAYQPDQAAIQSARCSQCGIPFCQVHCPLQNNIPDWLRLAAEGRLQDAYAISSATNTFPEICGRICPQDKLCEGNCVIERGFGSVTIGSVEKYITETAFAEGWVEAPMPAYERETSVGIIGSGPAGLAAADMLRREGHQVHVYDRHDRVGGLLIYGIPNFKLEKEIVQRRRALFEEAGIQFHLNQAIDAVQFKQLRQQHDAILIATGVYKARALDVPDATLPGIVPALDYLTASNRVCLGDSVAAYEDGSLNAKDKDVVVIGGGDTAMDCVRTAVRQGARSVICLYRRDRANMPGSAREVKNAEEEGVQFVWLTAPKAFIGRRHVQQILVQRMRLSAPESGGRQQVVPIEGDTYQLKADLVIQALGFEPEDLPAMFGAPELAVTKYGTLKTHPQTYETALPGVYAAGDIVRGASLVVWAIKDGREAAIAMHQQLSLAQKEAA
jgi:glutamate synthase (NADPH) small chain